MKESDLKGALCAYILDESLCERITASLMRAFADDTVGTSKGMLIQSFTGGGKTSVLKQLFSFFGSEVAYMLDCSPLRLAHRGHIESEMLNLCMGKKRLLLLVDNVDALPSSGKKGSAAMLTLSSTSFTSALLQVIDTGNVFVVATCTNAQDVDVGLLQPYRLGSPLVMKLPTKQNRVRIIETILSDPTVQLASDSPYEGVDAISKELALRTQGFSACDLWKLMREQYQEAAQRSALCSGAADGTVVLSSQQLFQAVSLAASSAQSNAQKDDTSKFVRPVDYDAPEPVLFGVQAVQQRLLQCIGTIVPELGGESATTSKHSMRKCSGVVLCGPSGAGKTALTDWLAHAVRRHCGFISVPCADLVHKVVGETEKRLAEIFATARELSPCIVLLDNLDMLLGASAAESDAANNGDSQTSSRPSGTGGRGVRSARTRHQAVDRMLSTLLVEIDGVYTTSSSAGTTAAQGGLLHSPSVLVVATTTSMSCLDRALVRPGRLEEHIALSLPGSEQREAYMLTLLRGLGYCSDDGSITETQSDLQIRLKACAQQCAASTPGRSYAHLRALYQEANIAFARETLFASMASSVTGCEITTTATANAADRVNFVLTYILNSCAN